jgi:hypothetical protein
MGTSLLILGERYRVAVYTVHEPPRPPVNRIDRADALVFVKDGFSWGAAFLPPVWLAFRGEWLGLAAYMAAALCLGLGLAALGANDAWVGLAILLLNITVGFEADEFERWSLARKEWREIGTVSGRDRDECERRFFDEWLVREPGKTSRGPSDHSGSLAAPAIVKTLGWRNLLGLKS